MWIQMHGVAGSVEWKEWRKRGWHQDSLSSVDLEVVRHTYWFLVESFVVDQNPKNKSVWYFPSQADQGYRGLAVILFWLLRQVNLKAEAYSPPTPPPSPTPPHGSGVAPDLASLKGVFRTGNGTRGNQGPSLCFPLPCLALNCTHSGCL